MPTSSVLSRNLAVVNSRRLPTHLLCTNGGRRASAITRRVADCARLIVLVQDKDVHPVSRLFSESQYRSWSRQGAQMAVK